MQTTKFVWVTLLKHTGITISSFPRLKAVPGLYNTLHVKGKRNVEEDGGTIETTFENHFKLGNNVDVDAVSAIVRDGVLELILPKKIVVDEVRTIAISEDKSRESGLQESDTTSNDTNNNSVDCEDGDDGDYINDLTLNETNDGLWDESAEDTIEL